MENGRISASAARIPASSPAMIANSSFACAPLEIDALRTLTRWKRYAKPIKRG
jgi:hypothetical protein